MYFNFTTGILILAAVFSYLNARFLKMVPMIAFMLGALLFSGSLLVLHQLGFQPADELIDLFSQVDFGNVVLYEILSFLLFAGALQTNFRELASMKWVILALSTLSVVISTFVVGTLMYWVFALIGMPISYIFALIFGALISPTDPIIVIGILKHSLMSAALRTKIVGEALFNDGIAIVLFFVLLGIAYLPEEVTVPDVAFLLAKQIIGSVALGLFLGWLTHKLLHKVPQVNAQVFITLGVVAGGYDTALWLGISGPITIVIAGLLFRNWKEIKPRQRSYQELYSIWGMFDELLNACLFILMGLEILGFTFTGPLLLAAGFGIVIVLFGRYVSVWVPIRAFSLFQRFSNDAIKVLTWAGLRGGISLALALTLPGAQSYNVIAFVTYIVVVFSLTIQVFVLKKLVT